MGMMIMIFYDEEGKIAQGIIMAYHFHHWYQWFRMVCGVGKSVKSKNPLNPWFRMVFLNFARQFIEVPFAGANIAGEKKMCKKKCLNHGLNRLSGLHRLHQEYPTGGRRGN